MFLYELLPGQSARVVRMQRNDRRLGDLGLIEGSIVACLFRSPLGDPTAYEIKGATIALRQRDARSIVVEVL